jgi:hypothetical protein
MKSAGSTFDGPLEYRVRCGGLEYVVRECGVLDCMVRGCTWSADCMVGECGCWSMSG